MSDTTHHWTLCPEAFTDDTPGEERRVLFDLDDGIDDDVAVVSNRDHAAVISVPPPQRRVTRTTMTGSDEEDSYVRQRRKAKTNDGGGASSFLAVSLATTAGVKFTGALLDEDDLFAGVGALVNAVGTGGGGGGGAVGGGVASMP